jgi:hypothetical protein
LKRDIKNIAYWKDLARINKTYRENLYDANKDYAEDSQRVKEGKCECDQILRRNK